MARRFARIATEEGAPSIAPLGALADLPVMGVPFRTAVKQELYEAHCTINEAAPRGTPALASLADSEGQKIQRDPARRELVLGPGTWINAATATAMLEAGPVSGSRLVLRAPGWARLAGGPVERAVDVAVIPAGTRVDAAARAALPPLILDADEKEFGVAKGPEALDVPAPRFVACDVRTWADLLWVSLFSMTARVRNLSPAKGLILVTVAAARSFSLNPWRVAGKLVEKGKGCDIHPSAVVEASVLGDGVKIGPGAVVRGSILKSGAEVEELALVVGSVVGGQARVQRQAMCKFSVLSNLASCGGTVQLSFFGEGASLRGGSYTIDRNLDGSPVRVSAPDGTLVDAGPVLGVVLGPGAMIGSGVWIGAGRAIPAGVTVIRPPYDTVLRFGPTVPPGVYAVVDGSLAAVPTGAPRPKDPEPAKGS